VTLNAQHANGSPAPTRAAHQVALTTAKSKTCRVNLRSSSTSTKRCKTKRPRRKHPPRTKRKRKRRVRRVHHRHHHRDPHRLRAEVVHHLHHRLLSQENPETAKSVKDLNLRQVVHLNRQCLSLCSTVTERDLLLEGLLLGDLQPGYHLIGNLSGILQESVRGDLRATVILIGLPGTIVDVN